MVRRSFDERTKARKLRMTMNVQGDELVVVTLRPPSRRRRGARGAEATEIAQDLTELVRQEVVRR
jgi:hypothetical protein